MYTDLLLHFLYFTTILGQIRMIIRTLEFYPDERIISSCCCKGLYVVSTWNYIGLKALDGISENKEMKRLKQYTFSLSSTGYRIRVCVNTSHGQWKQRQLQGP